MKRWMAVLVLMAAVVTPCLAEDTGSDGWTATMLGSDDLLEARVGTRPFGDKTEIGMFGLWVDGLAEGEEEAYGGGVYATYDLVQDAEFKILSFAVPVTWLVGGQMGALHCEDSDEDATASLLTGMTFGGKKIRLGVEAQYILDNDLWKEFSKVDDSTRILFTAQYRF
jgi:hypothetical protein